MEATNFAFCCSLKWNFDIWYFSEKICFILTNINWSSPKRTYKINKLILALKRFFISMRWLTIKKITTVPATKWNWSGVHKRAIRTKSLWKKRLVQNNCYTLKISMLKNTWGIDRTNLIKKIFRRKLRKQKAP